MMEKLNNKDKIVFACACEAGAGENLTFVGDPGPYGSPLFSMPWIVPNFFLVETNSFF